MGQPLLDGPAGRGVLGLSLGLDDGEGVLNAVLVGYFAELSRLDEVTEGGRRLLAPLSL
jgi:hypothetical protein